VAEKPEAIAKCKEMPVIPVNKVVDMKRIQQEINMGLLPRLPPPEIDDLLNMSSRLRLLSFSAFSIMVSRMSSMAFRSPGLSSRPLTFAI
jgi:hypothetical protein